MDFFALPPVFLKQPSFPDSTSISNIRHIIKLHIKIVPITAPQTHLSPSSAKWPRSHDIDSSRPPKPPRASHILLKNRLCSLAFNDL